MINDFAVFDDSCDNWVVVIRVGGFPASALLIPKDCGTPLTDALSAYESDSLPMDISVLTPTQANLFFVSHADDVLADFKGDSFEMYAEVPYVEEYVETL